MVTAVMEENLLSVTPDLNAMAEQMNKIIEERVSKAIRKEIAGKVRFAVEQSDGRCRQTNDITFGTEISLTDGSTGTCEVIQHGQTVFRARYDKYNKEIEKIEMYIPGSWEAVLDGLAVEFWHIQNNMAEKALHATADSWQINMNELETGGSR